MRWRWLWSAPPRQLLLLDVPRVFADRAYRLELLKRTSDKALLEFWRGIATLAGRRSAALENVAPYITCKLTGFTQNDLVRVIVGAQVDHQFSCTDGSAQDRSRQSVEEHAK